MKKYFNVSFQYSDGVFCANIAHAESAEVMRLKARLFDLMEAQQGRIA